MTPEAFAAWVAMMRDTRDWNTTRCARELGCGINQISIWSKRGPPRYIGLACSAIALGAPEWRPLDQAAKAASSRGGIRSKKIP